MFSEQKETRRPRSKLVVVFGSIFILAGLLSFYIIAGPQILNYFGSFGWQPVPAKIVDIRGDSKWQKNDNSSTRVYTIKANYRYSFQGVEYTGQQVTLDDNFDSDEKFWRSLETQLRRDNIQSNLQAWVNPQNPQQARLHRGFRWSKVFFASIMLLMFGGFGAAAVYFSNYQSKGKRSLADYAHGIKPNELTAEKVLFGVSAVFLVISLMLFFVLPSEMEKRNYAFLFTMAFPMMGLAFLYHAFKSRTSRRLIGDGLLMCDPLPGCSGGQVGGSFELRAESTAKPLKINLECASYNRSGKNTQRSLLWQDHQMAYSERSAHGRTHQFCFDVPKDQPASYEEGRHAVRWLVRAEGELQVDGKTMPFSRSWQIPVEQGESQMSEAVPSAFRDQSAAKKMAAAKTSAVEQISLETTADHLTLLSRSGRHTGSALGLALFGLAFFCAGLFPLYQALQGELFLWIFAVVFCGIGLIILAAGIWSWARRLDVHIDKNGMNVVRSLFSRPLYQRNLARPKSDEIVVRNTMKSTSGNKATREYFALQVVGSGVKQTIAEGVEGRHAAEALQRSIQTWLNGSQTERRDSVPESQSV